MPPARTTVRSPAASEADVEPADNRRRREGREGSDASWNERRQVTHANGLGRENGSWRIQVDPELTCARPCEHDVAVADRGLRREPGEPAGPARNRRSRSEKRRERDGEARRAVTDSADGGGVRDEQSWHGVSNEPRNARPTDAIPILRIALLSRRLRSLDSRRGVHETMAEERRFPAVCIAASALIERADRVPGWRTEPLIAR
jgi:hypothetical protein